MAIYLFLFLIGLFFGSFLSVIIYRETSDSRRKNKLTKYLPSWVAGRSCCDLCKTKLSWYENIPLLSYLIQRGKCRHCDKKITISYPLFELFFGLEFVWVYWLIQRFSFFSNLEGFYSLAILVYWIFIFSLAIVLSIIDIKKSILPDSLIIIGSVISILRLIYTGRWQFLLAGLALMLFFLALYYVAKLITGKEGMGLGDVKLAFFVGVTLGWWQWIVIAMFIAFVLGSIIGVSLIILGKKQMKSAIPFGPFMLLGMLLAKIFSDQIIIWYFNRIF